MNPETKFKQVIVMRHDLKMRRGKQIAQGAHTSMSFFSRRMQQNESVSLSDFTDAQRAWIEGAFAKVCCRVDSEEELDEIFEKASSSGLEVHLITDSVKTEFHGETLAQSNGLARLQRMEKPVLQTQPSEFQPRETAKIKIGLFPEEKSTPGRIRTCNPRFRRSDQDRPTGCKFIVANRCKTGTSVGLQEANSLRPTSRFYRVFGRLPAVLGHFSDRLLER